MRDKERVEIAIFFNALFLISGVHISMASSGNC